jgi:hypothetical protein
MEARTWVGRVQGSLQTGLATCRFSSDTPHAASWLASSCVPIRRLRLHDCVRRRPRSTRQRGLVRDTAPPLRLELGAEPCADLRERPLGSAESAESPPSAESPKCREPPSAESPPPAHRPRRQHEQHEQQPRPAIRARCPPDGALLWCVWYRAWDYASMDPDNRITITVCGDGGCGMSLPAPTTAARTARACARG